MPVPSTGCFRRSRPPATAASPAVKPRRSGRSVADAAFLLFASYLLAGGLGGPVDLGGLRPEGGQLVADGDDRPPLAGVGVHAQFLKKTRDLLVLGAVGETLGNIPIVWLGVGDRRVFDYRRTPVSGGLGGAAPLVTRRRTLAASRCISAIGRVSVIWLERQQAVEQSYCIGVPTGSHRGECLHVQPVKC